MKCIDCGKPTSAGRTDGRHKPHARCLPCETARLLKDFRYPASQSWQAVRRERETRT